MKLADGLHVFVWNSISANNCNTYLIDGAAKILIDPGHFGLFDHVAGQLRDLDIRISDIDLVLATHAHPDHFEAVKHFKGQPARFAISLEDWRLIQWIGKHMGPAFDPDAYTPDFFLGPGNLDAKGIELKVIPSPGHSPGSVALYWPACKALFCGDVLFRDGLGRTDLPGGDGPVLKQSIKELESYDSEFLLPGHGEIIQGAADVKLNFKRVEAVWFDYIG